MLQIGGFMNFRYRLMQFMSVRYGADGLSYGLIIFASALAFINVFIRSIFLQCVVYAMIFYTIFRMFSRNIAARRRENQWFMNKVLAFKRNKEVKEQRKADQLHIYKKCPKCKAVLRLPRRVGKHTTVCPKCNHQFKVIVKK